MESNYSRVLWYDFILRLRFPPGKSILCLYTSLTAFSSLIRSSSMIWTSLWQLKYTNPWSLPKVNWKSQSYCARTIYALALTSNELTLTEDHFQLHAEQDNVEDLWLAERDAGNQGNRGHPKEHLNSEQTKPSYEGKKKKKGIKNML